MKSKLLLIFLAVLLMSTMATVTAFTQEVGGRADISGGIIGLVVTVVISLFGAFGLSQIAAARKLSKARIDIVDVDEIDRAVETMLGKVGIPHTLADYIGDIVALASKQAPNFFTQPLMVTVKNIIIDEISRRSAIDAAKLVEGHVSADLLANRASRTLMAEDLVGTSQVQALIAKKVPA
jgi:hypothetical protein